MSIPPGFPAKGRIAGSFDADLVLLDEDGLEIDTVIARGRVMVQGGKPVVFGTFEGRSEGRAGSEWFEGARRAAGV